MLRQPLVFLLVALEMLLRAALHAAIDLNVVVIAALQNKEFLFVADGERILGGVGRTAERQEIDGVEHIRLARSVAAYKAVNLRRKLKCGLHDVLIIYD